MCSFFTYLARKWVIPNSGRDCHAWMKRIFASMRLIWATFWWASRIRAEIWQIDHRHVSILRPWGGHKHTAQTPPPHSNQQRDLLSSSLYLHTVINMELMHMNMNMSALNHPESPKYSSSHFKWKFGATSWENHLHRTGEFSSVWMTELYRTSTAPLGSLHDQMQIKLSIQCKAPTWATFKTMTEIN